MGIRARTQVAYQRNLAGPFPRLPSDSTVDLLRFLNELDNHFKHVGNAMILPEVPDPTKEFQFRFNHLQKRAQWE